MRLLLATEATTLTGGDVKSCRRWTLSCPLNAEFYKRTGSVASEVRTAGCEVAALENTYYQTNVFVRLFIQVERV